MTVKHLFSSAIFFFIFFLDLSISISITSTITKISNTTKSTKSSWTTSTQPFRTSTSADDITGLFNLCSIQTVLCWLRYRDDRTISLQTCKILFLTECSLFRERATTWKVHFSVASVINSLIIIESSYNYSQYDQYTLNKNANHSGSTISSSLAKRKTESSTTISPTVTTESNAVFIGVSLIFLILLLLILTLIMYLLTKHRYRNIFKYFRSNKKANDQLSQITDDASTLQRSSPSRRDINHWLKYMCIETNRLFNMFYSLWHSTCRNQNMNKLKRT